MQLFRKKTPASDAETAAEPVEDRDAPAQAAQWTNGSKLGTRAISIGVGLAVACGPVALIITGVSGGSSTAAPRAVATTRTSVVEQSAGSFAAGFVGAWLTADQDNSAALDDYTTTDIPQLPKNGFQYRDLAVTSATAPSDGLINVVVAANVKDDTIDSDDANQWPRRYYEVTVSEAHNKLAAVGLPAAVAGPKRTSTAPSLDYGQSISTSSAAGKTIAAFLSAYLTGQGATEPYTSPATSIPAIDPAPFSDLTISSISSVETPAESPKDGATVQAYITVTATNSVGQSSTSTYTMTLSARAGRWEVTALGDAPVLSGASDSIPSATSTTSSKGN